jgi:uncharacterized membrane protein YgcG
LQQQQQQQQQQQRKRRRSAPPKKTNMALAQLLSVIARARSVPSKGWKVLTSKQHPRRYKGKRAMRAGKLTDKGQFVVLLSMLPRYAVPDLQGFNLRPYVANYAGQSTRGLGTSGSGSSSVGSGSGSSGGTPSGKEQQQQ